MNYKLAFISGATSGLGKELSFLLAKKKIPLFLTGRDLSLLLELQKELQSETSVLIAAADLSSPSDTKQLLEDFKIHTPDLIINAAGLGFYENVLSTSLEKQMLMVQVNIEALSQISITAARLLKEQGRKGTIMNISSAAAHYTYPSFAIYAASKRFVRDFSLSFDYEVSKYGIRVLTCLPGRFHSAFKQKSCGIPSTPSWDTMSLKKTALHVLKQIETQKQDSIFDFRYKILRFISFFIPSTLIAKILTKKTPPG